MLVAALILALMILIAGLGIWVIIKIIKKLPPRDGGDDVKVEMVLPAYPAKSLEGSYRLVLQRTTDGTNWSDIMGADYNGQATTVGTLTNWTDFGLFRVRAYRIK